MARTSKGKANGGNSRGNGHANGAGNGLGVMDWFLAHGELRKNHRSALRSPEAQNYLNFLWPVALDYFSPLNPIFLNESLSLEAFNSWPIWMARDGLVPLLWFFKVHPTPGKFQQKILVHEELAPFVPDAWRSHMGSYRIVSTIQAPLPKNRKFLLTGLLMDTYVTLEALEKQLQEAVAAAGEGTFAKSEIIAFLPPRIDGFGNEHRHEFHSECIFRIARYLGTHVHAIPWRKLDSMDQLDGYEVIEFNERLLCSDSYLTQMALFRGARLLEKKTHVPHEAHEQLISLSPYHGVVIRQELEGKCMLQNTQEKEAAQYLEIFAQAMRSEANKRFPWPNWFAEWTRVIEHQSE
jgi:hypothetical protein